MDGSVIEASLVAHYDPRTILEDYVLQQWNEW